MKGNILTGSAVTFYKSVSRMAVLLVTLPLWGTGTLSATGTTSHCPDQCTCQDTLLPSGQTGLDMQCSGLFSESWAHADWPHEIHRLNLTRCGLTSFSRQNWPRLLTLKILDLSLNQMSGSQMHVDAVAPNLLSLNVSYNALTSVSFPLPKSLKVLAAVQNGILSFDSYQFRQAPDIETVYLDHNGIQNITCSGGTELRNLRTLSLTGNVIQHVETDLSLCLPHLTYVSLAGNRIRHITSKMARSFVHLQYLDLSNNQIQFVESKALHGLHSLRYLSLSGNQLQRLPSSLPLLEWLDLSYNLIPTLSEAETQSLYLHEVFLMGGNPLDCNCSLISLKELYDTREYQVNFLTVNRSKFVPACSAPPPLAGDSWDVLGDEVFTCELSSSDPPHTQTSETSLVSVENFGLRAVETTPVSIKLKWSVHMTSAESTEKHVIKIGIHPFGKKNLLETHSVLLVRGTYTLENLSPDTSYIVCVETPSGTGEKNAVSLHGTDCLELVTKPGNFLLNLGAKSLLYYSVTGIAILVMSALLWSQTLHSLGKKVFHGYFPMKTWFDLQDDKKQENVPEACVKSSASDGEIKTADVLCDNQEKMQ